MRVAVETELAELLELEASVVSGRARTEATSTTSGGDEPVVRIVDTLLSDAANARASDVHLRLVSGELTVRYRVDGRARQAHVFRGPVAEKILRRIKIQGEVSTTDTRRPQIGQFQLDAAGRVVDVRVSTIPLFGGEKVVLRLLERYEVSRSLDDLGMDDVTVARYRELCDTSWGVILVVGPTGAGKTVTTYATLEEIAGPTQVVATIEDPVEKVIPRFDQTQVDYDVGMDFAQGLRTVLRQDPNIIMVGEIRDEETARVAITAALSGHPVVATTHAIDAAAAVLALRERGVQANRISSALAGVVAQRLVGRICDGCRTNYEPDERDMEYYRAHGGTATTFARGAGCVECGNTGFYERIGVYEVMVMSPPMRALVGVDADHDELLGCALREGMRTMAQSGCDLVTRGITTIDEVRKQVHTL